MKLAGYEERDGEMLLGFFFGLTGYEELAGLIFNGPIPGSLVFGVVGRLKCGSRIE